LNENRVRSVYVRATADATEQVLRARLHRQFPTLDPGLDLVETIRAVDEGPAGAGDVKALIVLDQFEQWLAVHSGEQETELLNALRLCSQARVQCLLLVRDGFLMAAQRFMRSLDETLTEKQNWAAMDLFSTDHAVAVLTEFGRAWDKFDSGGPGAEQIQFMKQAVAALAKDGQVICVALALYAEMVKDRPWTLATLEGAGDLKEVGRTFLERSFGPSSGRRVHEKAARKVLESLLPPANVKIINRRRTRDELLQASGYAAWPEKFAELLKILTDDLPLVMEVEVDEDEDEGDRQTRESPELAPVQYRITHEFLVDPLRAWLEDEDRKRIRGRAKLALRKRTGEWMASAPKEPKKRDPTYLPGLLECGTILCFAPRSEFGDDQKELMRAARRRYAKWGGALSVPALIVGFLVWDQLAAARVSALLQAPPHGVSAALIGLEYFGPRAQVRCEHSFTAKDSTAQDKLHSAFYLATSKTQREDVQNFLVAHALVGPAGECENIVAALAHAPDPAIEKIKSQFESAKVDEQVRLATVALHLESADLATRMLQLREDPVMRTAFIHGYPLWYGEVTKVAQILDRDDVDPHLSSGLCAALGLIATHADKNADKTTARSVIARLSPDLLRLFQDAPDGGTHSAAWYALKRWRELEPSIQIPVLKPRQLSAGENPGWFVNTQGMVMIRIPHGSFTMGDDSSAASANEKPHKVTLTRDFYVSDREVTYWQFREFPMNAPEDPTCPDEWKKLGKILGGERESFRPVPDRPVQRVNWFEAVAFCNWLSRSEQLTPYYSLSKTGAGDGWKCDQNPQANGYRLPTEAEWEYACRAVSQKQYAFGDDVRMLEEYANYGSSLGDGTRPGGIKLPNGWGLFDMHGSVSEWCQDRYRGDYYSTSPTDDPAGPEVGSTRVSRGGDWWGVASHCRASNREWLDPGYRDGHLGFRLVRQCPASSR